MADSCYIFSLRITTAKRLQNIPVLKEDGNTVLHALYQELCYSPELAPSMSFNLFRQEEWLPEILEQLQSQPQEVVKQVERLRMHRT